MKKITQLNNLLDKVVSGKYRASIDLNNINIVEVAGYEIPNNLIADMDQYDRDRLALNLILNYWNVDNIDVYPSVENMEHYISLDYEIIMQDASYMEVVDSLTDALSDSLYNYTSGAKNSGFLTHLDNIAAILGQGEYSLSICLLDDMYTLINYQA